MFTKVARRGFVASSRPVTPEDRGLDLVLLFSSLHGASMFDNVLQAPFPLKQACGGLEVGIISKQGTNQQIVKYSNNAL